MDGGDWADPNARAIAIYLDGSDDPDRAEDGTPMLDDDFLVLVNSWWEPLSFVLPPTRPGVEWRTSAAVSALMYGSNGMCVVMNNRGLARLATYPAA